MKCDGVECQQSCYNGDCDMICPHGVSTCTQEAYDGNMTLRCVADEGQDATKSVTETTVS